MCNNGDYGITFTCNHHIVTVGQYQGTLMSCLNILQAMQNKLIFHHLKTKHPISSSKPL